MEIKTDSTEYAEAVRNLREWQGGATHFTAGVYGFIAKADSGNMEKLEREWPLLIRVYKDWWSSPDEDAFFATHLSERTE